MMMMMRNLITRLMVEKVTEIEDNAESRAKVWLVIRFNRVVVAPAGWSSRSAADRLPGVVVYFLSLCGVINHLNVWLSSCRVSVPLISLLFKFIYAHRSQQLCWFEDCDRDQLRIEMLNCESDMRWIIEMQIEFLIYCYDRIIKNIHERRFLNNNVVFISHLYHRVIIISISSKTWSYNSIV